MKNRVFNGEMFFPGKNSVFHVKTSISQNGKQCFFRKTTVSQGKCVYNAYIIVILWPNQNDKTGKKGKKSTHMGLYPKQLNTLEANHVPS